MIGARPHLLEKTLPEPEFVDAMRHAIDTFAAYRDDAPAIPNGYSRTLLHKTNAFELIVMRWAPGAQTCIHDHGESRCWALVVEGTLRVENFERLDEGSEIARLRLRGVSDFQTGQIDYQATWRDLHRVTNVDSDTSYSLQLYAAPLGEFTIVDQHTNAVRRFAPRYDAIIER
jgi:predicted metal-dependent enzyme (double-stranded beta helix superfamily)